MIAGIGTVHEGYLGSADGLRLFHRERALSAESPHIVLVHGVTEPRKRWERGRSRS
jgi:hypothetical protein